jgi:extracellular factor (EF) 3-hydroxypalmitic acid methyl ester biosynthesis protein
MYTDTTINECDLDFLKEIIDKGGPDECQYAALEENISRLPASADENNEQITELLRSCKFLQDSCSIMGHIRNKPHGYAGDFEIIDRIYRQDLSCKAHTAWDKYSLSHPAAAAVRNRKRYFKAMVKSKLETSRSLTLLNVASGPARDLYEVYIEKQAFGHLSTTCVEMDRNAITFAQNLNKPFKADIEFINKNIFRFQTDQKFELIWSAGLFEYFDEKSFVFLLENFGTWIAPGGEIVIGNFNDEHNPSRKFMELFGDWHLTHRSEQDLKCLAQQAGFSPSQITVGREEENINLFLHIKC